MNAKGYFKFLLGELHINSSDFNYYDLCWHLFQRPFTWSIRNDENRSADGINLRSLYLRSGGALMEKEFKEPCSVFEMMVALSVRCDHDILGIPEVDKSDKLFWIMIENLGLDYYEDGQFNRDDVDDILDVWLLRRFNSHGNGSPFPVRKVVRNQKKLEIWSEMHDFLNENFGDEW